jgi:endogenous inhibitor of DNA gyrase (YacG/DUF329 family)
MKPILVPCPTCAELSAYDPQNPFRPFCSERCKLIDLGEWASESYRVPSSESLELDELLSDPD